MGLDNRSSTPITYVQFNAKTGKLVTTAKNAEGVRVKTDHDTISGMVSGLKITEDEYDGEKIYKLNVMMYDGPARYSVQLNAATRQALELMGRMNSADVGHPMLIGGYVLEAGQTNPDGSVRERDLVGVTLRQGDGFKTKIDPFYSPELGGKQPAAIMLKDDNGNPVKIKGVEQIDKEASDNQRAELLMALIAQVNAKLQGQGQAQGQSDAGVDADEAVRNSMRARAGG